jgi:hypothetical protein
MVDHKTPISVGGDVLDWNNLCAMDWQCHAIKTQQDIQKFGPVGNWSGRVPRF